MITSVKLLIFKNLHDAEQAACTLIRNIECFLKERTVFLLIKILLILGCQYFADEITPTFYLP